MSSSHVYHLPLLDSSYLIVFVVKNRKGKKVLLDAPSLKDRKRFKADSALRKSNNDTLYLKGLPSNDEGIYSLRVDSTINFHPILIKNQVTELHFDWLNMPNPYNEASLYKNSPASVDYNSVLPGSTKWLRRKYILKHLPSDSLSLPSTQKEIDSISNLIVGYYMDVIKKTSSTATVWSTLQFLQMEETMKPYDELLDFLRKKFPTSELVRSQIDWFNKWKFTSNEVKFNFLKNGLTAPDLAFKTVSGEIVKLSSFRGKYVLLDFWASWCKPCREESPFLKEAYRKFKDKKFMIVQVSIDKPEDLEKWKAAIKEDQVEEFIQAHVDRNQEPYKQYKLESIPTNYLLSPIGKIMDSNLRGTRLETRLMEVLSKSK
ncbi:MAG: TlpA disulfide reductase family protein [Bacteroidota bacterium]